MRVMQAGHALVLFAFFFVVESRLASAVCVLLMAGFGFASVSPIQRLVMDKAPAAGAPNLAASVNIGLFNLGNAIGAWLGGWVIAAGFGYAAPNWVGGMLSTCALLLAIASGWLTVSHVAKRKGAIACNAS
ncbi:MFS transporter [Pseudomonas syringae]|uniref:MFS transporter n=2 Tax=Pseudomonas syringae TaxID=317 RepID=UPI00192A041F|nr:MFS transporter [Pseudomonas syringae]